MLIFACSDVCLVCAADCAVVIALIREPTDAETLLKVVMVLLICCSAAPICVASCPVLSVLELSVVTRFAKALNALVVPAGVAHTREPTAAELALIRDRLDPAASRDREVPNS